MALEMPRDISDNRESSLCRQGLVMNRETKIIPASDITPFIHSIRNQRVILDSDLAKLYRVRTFRLNEAVKRNRERFRKTSCSSSLRRSAML